ncbi:hypothetical protein NM688_g8850 [Phlebia brevispora]|uniref:Uncharacterized protein n=1 Tax=Phlebia brevispora TaxID=194682 RepID=A0ACC1RP47_9APHY|nr:hypothetical protein NM688_g8850 [Phlebia brevispora]
MCPAHSHIPCLLLIHRLRDASQSRSFYSDSSDGERSTFILHPVPAELREPTVQGSSGIISPRWGCCPPDPGAPAWETLSEDGFCRDHSNESNTALREAHDMQHTHEGYAADDEDDFLNEESEPSSTDIRAKRLKFAIDKHVRENLKHLLGLNAGDSPIESPTAQEIHEYMKGDGEEPSIADFRLDYASPSSGRYNQAAFRAFAKWFAALVSQHTFPNIPPEPHMDPEYFFDIAISKFRYLRDRYRAVSPRSIDKGEVEVAQDSERVRALASRRRAFRQKRAASDASSVQTPRLKLLSTLLDSMGASGMSSDETDVEVATPKKCYRRLRRPWINPLISKAFHLLDVPGRHVVKGQPILRTGFRRRIYDHRRDSICEPVPGLPRNVYDPKFLSALSNYELEALKIAADLDLTPLTASLG